MSNPRPTIRDKQKLTAGDADQDVLQCNKVIHETTLKPKLSFSDQSVYNGFAAHLQTETEKDERQLSESATNKVKTTCPVLENIQLLCRYGFRECEA